MRGSFLQSQMHAHKLAAFLFGCVFIWIVVTVNDVIISGIALACVAYFQYIIHIYTTLNMPMPPPILNTKYHIQNISANEIPFRQSGTFVQSIDIVVVAIRPQRKQKSQFTRKRVWNEKWFYYCQISHFLWPITNTFDEFISITHTHLSGIFISGNMIIIGTFYHSFE